MKLCCMILAAGASSRLGRPKQLLKKGNKTLLVGSVETALAAGFSQVYVVLGARQELIKPAIEHLPVEIITHEGWQEGIGSSIRKGIDHVQRHGQWEAVLLMLSDQVRVETAHLQALMRHHQQTQQPIVATGYQGGAGVPALFHRSFFPHLAQLSGDIGARKIIREHQKQVGVIDLEQAAVDIDTPEDAKREGLT